MKVKKAVSGGGPVFTVVRARAVVPVLYFGENVSNADHERNVFGYTNTTMGFARKITRSDGSPIPLWARLLPHPRISQSKPHFTRPI